MYLLEKKTHGDFTANAHVSLLGTTSPLVILSFLPAAKNQKHKPVSRQNPQVIMPSKRWILNEVPFRPWKFNNVQAEKKLISNVVCG